MLDIVDCVLFEIKKAGYQNRLGAGIVLTGGGALTRNLDVLFREHTHYDVRVAVPDTHVTEESAELINSPAYSTAVGLLLKAAGAGATMRTGSTRPPVVVRTATPLPPVAKVPTPPETGKTPAEEVESTRSSRRRWNELAAARRSEPEEQPEQPEPEPEEEGGERPKSWWQRAKERLTSTFEVIDDEI
jgi:cell division protein FtsA